MMPPRLRYLALCAAIGFGLQACADAGRGRPDLAARPGAPQGRGPVIAAPDAARAGGAFKIGTPYQIGGTWYYPKEDYDYSETGIASWYGPGFNGKLTANGEVYNQDDLTAAHRTLPMPSIVQVTNLDNGRSIKVRINDRGPFARSRIIDLSRRGAELLGFEQAGTAKVLVEIVEHESRQIASAALNGAAALDAPRAAPMVAVKAEPLPGTAAPTSAGSPAASQTALAVPHRLVSSVAPLDQSLDGVTTRPVGLSDIYVQAGAFTNFDNANRLRALLSQLGNVRIASALVEDKQFFRVQIGPIASVDEADRVLAMLLDNGHGEARVVVD